MMKLFKETIDLGRYYSEVWPGHSELGVLFPEARVITALKFASKTLPGIAVLSLMGQHLFGSPSLWPSIIAIVLFAASLPLQGLFWLGKRAKTRLSPSLSHWYDELLEKLKNGGHDIQYAVSQPCYLDLARVLRQVYEQLDFHLFPHR